MNDSGITGEVQTDEGRDSLPYVKGVFLRYAREWGVDVDTAERDDGHLKLDHPEGEGRAFVAYDDRNERYRAQLGRSVDNPQDVREDLGDCIRTLDSGADLNGTVLE